MQQAKAQQIDQKINSLDIGQSHEEVDRISVNEKNNSHYTHDEYIKQLFKKDSLQLIKKEDLINLLQENEIIYCEDYFYPQITVKKIVNSNSNKECITIDVAYAHFTTIMHIINIDCYTPTKHLTFVNKGKFGSIYSYRYNQKAVAIKVKIIQTFQSEFKEALKQYFILLIASILGIGPTVHKLYGFDLAIYIDSIEFCMQLCKKINKKKVYNFDSLKMKLYMLHLLHIVHLDIKPDNISFDPTRQQLILLDFGLSEIIKQNLDQKRYIDTFSGSLDYCSQQMKKLFFEKKAGWVSLYENDVHGILKSILQLSSHQQQIYQEDVQVQILNIDEIVQQMDYIKNCSYQLKLAITKYYLYMTLYQFWNLQDSQLKMCFTISNISIINFLRTTPYYYQYLNNIYYVIKITNIHFSNKFQQLQNLYLKYEFLQQTQNEEEDGEFIHTQRFVQKPNNWQLQKENNFKIRFNKIKYLNLVQLSIFWDEDGKKDCCLFNKEMIDSIDIQRYYLILINFIKINGIAENREDVVNACRTYNQNRESISHEDIYYHAFTYILQFSLKLPFTHLKYQILQNMLETIFILQIVPQSSIQFVFTFILQLKIYIFNKLTLCFKMITFLEYINQKYISIYDYNYLKENFISKLTFYLQSSKQNLKQQKQILLIDGLRMILTYDPESAKQYNTNFFKPIKQMRKVIMNEEYDLFEQINNYGVYYNRMSFIDTIPLHYHDFTNFFPIYIDHSQKITAIQYDSFYRFKLNYLLKQQGMVNNIYQLFMKGVGHFKKYQYFKIRAYYLLYILQKRLYFGNYSFFTNNLKEHQKQYVSRQLQNICSQVIQKSHFFSQFVYQLCVLVRFKYRNEYISLIKSIITNNKAFIPTFSGQYDFPTNKLHPNILKSQIKMFYILLQIGQTCGIFKKEEPIFESFFTKIYHEIDLIQCFNCKAISNIEANLSKLSYLIQHDINKEKVLDKIINLISFLFKNIELKMYEQDVMMVLLCKSILPYDLIYLLLQWMKNRNNYLFLVTHEFSKNIFQFIYNLLQFSFGLDQLYHFIIRMSQNINNSQSFLHSYNYYIFLKSLIKEKIKKQEPVIFQQCQSFIVKKIVQKQTMDPYCSLYLLSLFQCKNILIQLPYKQMVLYITKSFNYVDYRTKILILSEYYSFFIQYFNTGLRKSNYLRKFICKYTQTSKPIDQCFKKAYNTKRQNLMNHHSSKFAYFQLMRKRYQANVIHYQ